MSSHAEYLEKLFAFSYRQLILALVSAAVASAGFMFAPDAFAQLTVGGGGTCTRNTLKCPNSGTTALKPKFCSCPQINVGYCTSCTQACSSSCLGGSTFGLFSGAQLPIDEDSDAVNENPITAFLTGSDYNMTGGPSFQLICTQGTAGTQCPLGVPVVQATQQVTISKSALTITLATPITGLPETATPAEPFKVQVAGSKQFNDRVYTVVGVSGDRRVLSLLERPNRNETVTATVALANITLTFAGIPETNPAKVYFRHFNDPVSDQEPQCVVASDGRCEDGAATAEGYFNAQVKCANAGTELKLPCDVQAFAGNSQLATFTFPADKHNFSACDNGAVECAIGWSDPDKVNNAVCKKYFPAVAGVWELCQTLKFTISAGASISDFKQRAFNSAPTPTGTGQALAFSFVTLTDTPGGVQVHIIAGPDPLQTGNPGSSGVLTVSITNNEAANLQNIDVASVVLTFRNYGGAGAQSAVVENDRAPESCGTDCRNFKFGKTSFLDAYLSVYPNSTCTIGDGEPIPVHLVGAYTTGGEVFGDAVVHTNGVYTNTDPKVCTPTP